MRVGLPRRVSKEPSVISGDVDRVVESPHVRLVVHLNRPGFSRKRVTATAMPAPPFDVGHRTHPGVIPKTLNEGAATGVGLAAKIRQGDGGGGMVVQPAPHISKGGDPGRRAWAALRLSEPCDEGLQQHGHRRGEQLSPPPAALPLNLLRIDPNTMDQPLHLMAA